MQSETGFCKDAVKYQGYLFAPIDTVYGSVQHYVAQMAKLEIKTKADAKMYLKKISQTTKMLRNIWFVSSQNIKSLLLILGSF